MQNHQTHRRDLTRKTVAVALLCLFVLRAMGFIGMAAAMTRSGADNPVFVHAVLGDQCARRDGSEAPTKGADFEHCLLCSSLARETAALSALAFVGVVLFTQGEVVAAAPRFEELVRPSKPPGLIANWSATSPPG